MGRARGGGSRAVAEVIVPPEVNEATASGPRTRRRPKFSIEDKAVADASPAAVLPTERHVDDEPTRRRRRRGGGGGRGEPDEAGYEVSKGDSKGSSKSELKVGGKGKGTGNDEVGGKGEGKDGGKRKGGTQGEPDSDGKLDVRDDAYDLQKGSGRGRKGKDRSTETHYKYSEDEASWWGASRTDVQRYNKAESRTYVKGSGKGEGKDGKDTRLPRTETKTEPAKGEGKWHREGAMHAKGAIKDSSKNDSSVGSGAAWESVDRPRSDAKGGFKGGASWRNDASDAGEEKDFKGGGKDGAKTGPKADTSVSKGEAKGKRDPERGGRGDRAVSDSKVEEVTESERTKAAAKAAPKPKAAANNPFEFRGEHCEVKKHSDMGCCVVTMASEAAREALLEIGRKSLGPKGRPQVHIGNLLATIRPHVDTAAGAEVKTDLFVAWGHQAEKQAPLAVETIAKAFDGLYRQSQGLPPRTPQAAAVVPPPPPPPQIPALPPSCGNVPGGSCAALSQQVQLTPIQQILQMQQMAARGFMPPMPALGQVPTHQLPPHLQAQQVAIAMAAAAQAAAAQAVAAQVAGGPNAATAQAQHANMARAAAMQAMQAATLSNQLAVGYGTQIAIQQQQPQQHQAMFAAAQQQQALAYQMMAQGTMPASMFAQAQQGHAMHQAQQQQQHQQQAVLQQQQQTTIPQDAAPSGGSRTARDSLRAGAPVFTPSTVGHSALLGGGGIEAPRMSETPMWYTDEHMAADVEDAWGTSATFPVRRVPNVTGAATNAAKMGHPDSSSHIKI